MLRLLPIALTIARIPLGFAFPLASDTWQPWILLIGAFTDLIDGRVARLLKVDGPLGKYLDPIADKLFAIGVLIGVVQDGLVSPAWLILLLTRDFVVVLGTLALFVGGRIDVLARMAPSVLGKLATAAQFSYFVTIVFLREPLLPLLIAVVTITIVAGLDYARRGWRASFRNVCESVTGCAKASLQNPGIRVK